MTSGPSKRIGRMPDPAYYYENLSRLPPRALPRGCKARRPHNPCPKSGRPARDEWPAVASAASNAAISESLTPSPPHIQRRPSSATLSAASRAKTRLIAASAVASKRMLAFSLSLPSAMTRGAAGQAAGALRIGDQLAQAQQNVLVTGQPRGTGLLHHFGQRVQGQRRDVGAHVGMASVQLLRAAAPGRGSTGRAFSGGAASGRG